MQLPGEFSPFIEKKVVFCLVVGGVTPLPPLSGPTTKKNTFFMCVFPYLLTNQNCNIFPNLRVYNCPSNFFLFLLLPN